MANPTVEDILHYAISREVEANVFYNLLSQYIDDVEISSVCKELAGEELEHKARLELEIMKLGRTVKPFQRPDKPIAKPLDYMLDLARVMEMNLPELVLLAMEKEKISFRFYIDIMTQVKDESVRQVIFELIEAEARHKMRFELEYDRLTSSQQKPLV